MARIGNESKPHSNCYTFMSIMSNIGLKSVHLVSYLPTQCRAYSYTISCTYICLLLYTDLIRGSTIALQTFTANEWLSCRKRECDVHTCPGTHFTNSDWNRCKGELFKIHQLGDNGQAKDLVLVGDVLGLEYTDKRNQWLGCAGEVCERSSCPGKPSNKYGFDSKNHHFRCYGEVFRIYAKDKKEKETIESDSDIMLYHVQNDKWLSVQKDKCTSVGDKIVVNATCPGKSRPPSTQMYDNCASEVFRILERP